MPMSAGYLLYRRPEGEHNVAAHHGAAATDARSNAQFSQLNTEKPNDFRDASCRDDEVGRDQ